MSAVAMENLDKTVIRPFQVAASNTVRKGFPVKLSSGKVVEAAAVGDNAIGIALEAGDGDSGHSVGTVTKQPNRIKVALFGNGYCKVLVGTGGATAGAPAKFVSNGLTDGTAGGGSTKLTIMGQFLETGVAGDLVGLNLGMASFSVGS